MDVPKDLAARLIERLQAGGQRFLSWEVDQLVTIYLYADPGPVHEQVIDDVRDVIKLSLAEVPGKLSLAALLPASLGKGLPWKRSLSFNRMVWFSEH